MSRSVLVVAAHPDDEVLGCGGTLARHAAAGDLVRILFLADGVSARHDDADAAKRIVAAREAAAILGAEDPVHLGLPDNRLDTLPLLDLIQPVEAAIREHAPEIVYTHHGGDLNVDHRIAHQAVVTACRPQPSSAVKEIYAFETLSSTEWQTWGDRFLPQHWVDIAPFLERKLEALKAYGDEMRPFPHTRSFEGVEALARSRGTAVGVAAAEAFSVVRTLAA